ncbi:hypothetical protein tinsulaeT_19230 [Thalassotalea insulae]|uniref:Uncharacterized protein n=1 Tax=Thalassotalea insulae TaxID=2056778 RepID=A0ABQ6GRN9_9GAMM|nr:hypothetical protein [Thalassotalea insulae]GLX78583.1 hypothetical protein tinsulaeT_19230 [Thalassotalea insulae]
MKSIEQSLAEGLTSDEDVAFNTPDDELFKRAATTVNVQQGSKDLLALGMASIWVVFVSIFIKILKPVLNNMAQGRNK